jgi:hypothetical protein
MRTVQNFGPRCSPNALPPAHQLVIGTRRIRNIDIAATDLVFIIFGKVSSVSAPHP